MMQNVCIQTNLCDKNIYVSMTINDQQLIISAFFLNAAIDQQVENHLRETQSGENYIASIISQWIYLATIGKRGDRLVDALPTMR